MHLFYTIFIKFSTIIFSLHFLAYLFFSGNRHFFYVFCRGQALFSLLTVRKLHSQMTFLLFWAMMLVAHGLPNMISGVNSIIFINMLAYPIPLPSILQQSEVLNLPELVTLPDRSKKEKALT